MDIKYRISAAAGRVPAELLIKNATVVSVLADRFRKTNIAIADGVIVGFGDYKARREIDVKGSCVSFGLVDAHIHLESSLLVPAQFAREALARGTTAVIADPHEIANVWGKDGIKWMLEASKNLPMDVYFTLPSCVPASQMETSGARLGAADLAEFANHPRVVGMGEMMDFPSVIAGRPSVLAKTQVVKGKRVEGHAPMLTGKQLYAYAAANISSDHESTSADEAREKLFAGLRLMIREGSTAKNLDELLSVVTTANSHRCMFCCDDLCATDLVEQGHIDRIIRAAVAKGLPPITALQLATNNACYYFRIKEKKGAVAVGYAADLIVFESLNEIRPTLVFKGGKLVAKEGEVIAPCSHPKLPVRPSIKTKGLSVDQLRIPARNRQARVMGVIPSQIITKEIISGAPESNGMLASDISRDILKIAVVERHFKTGRVGLGLVSGFGLKRGAIASSVAHDSHNIIVVGSNDEDMAAAVSEIAKMGGGMVAVAGGKKVAGLPLPVAGLMSTRPAAEVAKLHADLSKVAREMGCPLHDPYLQLSFLALPVIPELKLTDRGLVDSKCVKFVPLFV